MKVPELAKFLRNPHGEKIQLLKRRYLELDELSNVAVEIGNATAYKSLQTELKEVFLDYLSAVVVDSVYRLVPHVLIIWVISLKWPNITVPIVNRQLNILVAYLLAYLIYNIGQLLVNPIKSGITKLGFTVFSKNSVINKL